MKAFIWLIFLHVLAVKCAQIEDNEFAEFEDFDDDDSVVETVDDKATPHVEKPPVTQPVQEETSADEEKRDDFAHFDDAEEFEGFDKATQSDRQKLKIAQVPIHFRSSWESYYLEILMILGLAAYFANFLAGKSKNYKLAQKWLDVHKDLLEANFSLVGDDGSGPEPQSGILMKETESLYQLWCSGRVCCEGMLVELKFLKRQDLVNVISKLFKPGSDQVIVRVRMDAAEMDSFVFACGLKKSCTKLQKEMLDLSNFCPEKRSGEKYGLPANYQILCETGEPCAALLDSKMQRMFHDFDGIIDYVHFSDQYSGAKPQDDSQQTQPETTKMLIFCFTMPGKGRTQLADIGAMKPLMQMVFHCIGKVSRFRMSKETKAKTSKSRNKEPF